MKAMQEVFISLGLKQLADCINMFHDMRIWCETDKIWKSPNRGYMLGMFNMGFTLVSIIIHKMNPVKGPKFICGNDDSLV